MFVRLLLPISVLLQTTDAAYWKYIVAIQSQSSDTAACPPPVPTVTIRTGNAPVTIAAVEATSCVPYASGPGLVCTGNGTVTFYIEQISNPGNLIIDMNPRDVAPFTCTAGLPVAQAYTLGQLCPDGNNQMMNVLNCSPAAAFARTGLRPSALGSVICVTDCSSGVCTQDSFFEFVRTERANTGCTWDTADAPIAAPTLPAVAAPTPAPVPAPTFAPVPAPTFPPVPAPTFAPVPAPTFPPVPAPTFAPVPAPTFPPVPLPTLPPVVPPTLPPTPAPAVCRKYADTCTLDSDCCSDRCVFQVCQKVTALQRPKMSDGRGGAGGAARAGGTRKLQRGIRGATA